MPVMHARMTLALGFSTAAHVGLVWVVGDSLPSFAPPAQQALTVAMTPAAPRPVVNSIAPSATSSLAPSPVQALEPTAVPVVDEPDTLVAARIVDRVELLEAPLVESRGPERSLRAREAHTASLMMAAAKRAEMHVTKVRRRQRPDKPLPTELDPRPATSPRARPESRPRRTAAAAPAPAAVDGRPGSGRQAHAPTSVAGRAGADRNALPAAGNAPPEYPWVARARGHEGRVVVSVWVSADGHADELAVLQSSGHAELDRAAVDAVARWRFQPARRGGRDTGSLLYVPVMFRLDD